jgi:hypothetical protein
MYHKGSIMYSIDHRPRGNHTDPLGDSLRQAAEEAYQQILHSGARVVQHWYGTPQLQEILHRFAAATEASGRYVILDVPLGLMAQHGFGWNAYSLPDGTLLFNFDLLNAAWAVASGYVRWTVDRSFQLESHFQDVVGTLHARGRIMPTGDPARTLHAPTSLVFRDMVAFVVGHELAHYIRHHRRKRILARIQAGEESPHADTLLSQAHEFEADQVAVDIMVQTWAYDPRGAVLALLFMCYLDDQEVPSPADSHPPPNRRLARVQEWLKRRGLAHELG